MSRPPPSPGSKRRNRRPSPGRPRTGARVAAVQALFQSEQTGDSAEAVIDQFVRHRIGPAELGRPADPPAGFEDGRVPEADVPLFADIVRTAAANGEAMDGLVRGHLAAGWPMDRLDPVLRAVLRAAATELSRAQEPPARVLINEYLDIAHGFMSEDGTRFANGVLNAMARRLRPAEFAAGAGGG